MTLISRSVAAWLAVAFVALAGCAQTNRAPVEDRTSIMAPPSDTAAAGSAAAPPPNANRPGFYTVQPKDTLYRIALESGQSWKDLKRWNELEDENHIAIGQVLRVVPPVGENVVIAADTGVEVTPVTVPTATPSNPSAKPATPPPSANASAPPASAAPTPPVQAGSGKSKFIWPANGKLIARFNEASNKGVDIEGKEGDPVRAAAAGKVVYAGSDLRGYGNLIILQHDSTHLTAYAHNKKLLVKEDKMVKQGEQIAEMGRTDADRVKLHFELRRQGKPIDPLPLLPTR